MNQQDARKTTEEIIALFETHGQEDYDGEPVSQASHMIQCAMQAMAEGNDIELLLGAFLHDIGHLLRHTEKNAAAMGNYGAVNHEQTGASYLRSKGFSERICAMVAMHVQAKRYLVATDAGYLSRLSPASLQTLEWQGGPMTDDEVKTFSQHPFFNDIIKVRCWDEEAKQVDAVVLPLTYFKNLVQDYLNDYRYAV